MPTTREQLEAVAGELASICCRISIKEDEDGPLVLAFGLKDTHSLELRKVEDCYVLELWHGKTAEVEAVIEEVRFTSIDEAKRKAAQWLLKDAT